MAFTRKHLDGLGDRTALIARLEELSYIDFTSAPRRKGRRYFFSRRHRDKEKSVYYVRTGRNGKARVLLDPNTMSKDGSVAVKGVFPSHDGKRVIYKRSENNADAASLVLLDVATGRESKVDTIDGAKYAYPAWTPRGDAFYYVRIPTDGSVKTTELPAHAQVYRHKIGTDPKTDTLVYEKTGDPKIFLGVDLSRDGHLLTVQKSFGWNRTEIVFKDLRRDQEFRPLFVGHNARADLDSHRGRFVIRTNLDAPNWRLVSVDPKRPSPEHWVEVVPARADAVLKRFEVVGGKLSLSYLKNASSELELRSFKGKLIRTVQLPGIGSSGGLTGHPEDDTAYFAFSSFTTPHTIFETSVRRGGKKVYSEVSVPIDSTRYQTEQVWYRSKDGTKVSMFILQKKGAPRDGSTAFLLYGYGGFNISLTPSFSGADFVWLENGGGLAIPNLRGGGEYGEAWHKSGMLDKKQNVFDDFIAAAEYLIDKRYTSSQRLAISGGSNGGLLVGAMMTQRPDLMRAVSCRVPLLDMLRYHRFGAGKTWISEYGSADDPKQFKALRAYSPYHHVRKGTKYPALLMLSADSDDRVHPMHARKFVARVQAATRSKHPVLLRVEGNAGHGGGDMVKKRVKRKADSYAFLFHELGMKLPVNEAAADETPAKPKP